jgi:lactoylglutathione lyase
MTAKLLSACGYQGDAMNLPVADVDAAAAYYVEKMGFRVVEQDTAPSEPPQSEAVKRIVLDRDSVRIGLAENGGDPNQDGCAFHTDDVQALHEEFAQAGLERLGEFKDETRDDGSRFRVFFVVAPDGLCFWFGERV